MSPRVAGAALALLAAILLVASVAGIPAGWWAGHPLRNGEAMHKKDIDVSLLTAIGCNTGGDSTCQPLEMEASFDAVRYAELGGSGILVLACLLLAGMTLAASERRKGLALLVIAVGVACAGIAAALMFMPKMKAANIELPVGAGVFVFFGGIACALLGSLLARRPTPKLELQPPRQSFAPALAAPPAAQPVDVLALLQPETRQEPMTSRPPPSPGGQLAGPAGPLAPPSIGSAPYNVPTQPPMSAPPPTNLPPTPMPAPFGPRPGGPPLATPPPPDGRPRSGTGAPPLPDRSKSSSQVPAIPGDRSKGSGNVPAIPGDRSKASSEMPSIPADRSKSSSAAPAIPGDRSRSSSSAPAIPGDRSKSSSSVPAIPGDRFKASSTGPGLPGVDRPTSASTAPPIPGAADRSKGSGPADAIPEARSKSPSAGPPSAEARTKAASIAPPGAEARTKAASIAPPTGDARPKSPSVGPVPSTVAGMMPPARTKGATGAPPPRAKGPSVPPPASAARKTNVAAVVPMPYLPMRADTDPTDGVETMDRDAMTIARDGASSVSVGRPATDASIGDNTDASVRLPDVGPADESTDLAALPLQPRDSASDIQTSAQRKLTPSELVRAVARESQSEIETIAREKLSARDLAVGDSTSPVIVPPGATRSEIEELGEATTAPAPSTQAKRAMSTAPDSLPPPKEEAAPAAGPTPACPQCEAPMAWVEEHLRFYCKSCRMYF